MVSCPAGRCLAACWPGWGGIWPHCLPPLGWGGLAAGGGRVQRAAGQGEHCEHLGGSLPRGLAGLSLTVPAALSFLLFNLLCAPCLAALAALRQEMASPAFLVRGGLSDRVGLADRLWGLSGGNAAPPAITPSQGRAGCATERGKTAPAPTTKGALVLFTERTRFRSGPGTGTGERGCPMRLFPSPRTGRPSPGLQPGLPGPWRQSTGRRFSGCGPR